MSCPDWRRLAAIGDDFLRSGSSARRAVVEHAADCPQCRRRALRLDPTLALAELPAPPEPSPSEVAAIKANVLALRRVRRVEAAGESRRRSPARLAAVAALTLVVLLFARETGDRAGDPGGRAAPSPAAGAPKLLSEDYRLYGQLPLVESLEPAQARVYQLGRDDFSLVWIVDESIEVEPEAEPEAEPER